MGEVILTMKDIDKSFPGVHAETVGRLGGQNRVDSLVADSPVPDVRPHATRQCEQLGPQS